jgi:hypothetical protein
METYQISDRVVGGAIRAVGLLSRALCIARFVVQTFGSEFQTFEFEFRISGSEPRVVGGSEHRTNYS